jgi:precorrin-6B methylase 2
MTTWENAKAFIQQHEGKPLVEVALLLSKQPHLPKDYILNQINGRAKAKQKLPEFYANERIIYPSYLSMEQCSSETTALYKAHLFKGNLAIDLTCGFGVDAYYLSKQFEQVITIEPNAELIDITTHNYEALNANNIKVVQNTAEEFLPSAPLADLIYIDPSRRVKTRKVFKLIDGVPNVVELLPKMLALSPKVMIKTSPLQDITQSLHELSHVKEVHVVAVNNECKEILYILERNYSGEALIKTINLAKTTQTFDFYLSEEQQATPSYTEQGNYVYEPNAAILNAGAFSIICKKYGVQKLAPNSHVYLSNTLVEDFPGRQFKLTHVCNYNAKDIAALGITQANITTRNFPYSVDVIRKKLKLKDGGDTYIFATKNQDNKPILVISEKI